MEESIQSLKEKMRCYWKDLLSRECGLSSKELQNIHQPCPICGAGENRYRFDDAHGDGTWYCNFGHGGKKAGDGFSFLQHYKNIEMKEVCNIVKDYLNLPNKKRLEQKKGSGGLSKIDPIFPAPELHYKPGATLTLTSQKNGGKFPTEYEYFWEWKDHHAERVGYIGRKHKDQSGTKKMHQIFHSEKGWIQGTISDSRPPFCSRYDKDINKVIIVEGEKTADLVAKFTTGYNVITWVGGASNNTCLKVDWSFLRGKQVFLFPDNDIPSAKKREVSLIAMEKIYKKIRGICTATIIPPPPGKEDSWDLVDLIEETKDGFEDFETVLDRMIDEAKRVANPIDRNSTISNLVRPLGFLNGVCYIMHWHEEPRKKVYVQEVKAVSSGSITKNELCFWADYEDWKNAYGEKFDLAEVASDLRKACTDKGVYDDRKIRGSGFWKDDGRIIFHAGTRLYIDGEIANFTDFETDYIYQSRPSVVTNKFDFNKTLSKEEKDQIIKVFFTMNAATPLMTIYNLGWTVLSVVCGALQWRPHQYIEGKRGSGKSSIFKAIKALHGDLVEDIVDSPTEASIRQRMRCDARPVLFDESEAKKNRHIDYEREKINAYKKACCSDLDSFITRGTSSGNAIIFKPRSMFLEAGTHKPENDEAGESREVYVEFLHESVLPDRENIPDDFKRFFEERYTYREAFGEKGAGGIIGSWAEEKLSDRFIASVATILDDILHNASVLKNAIIARGGDGRMGDTYGMQIGAAIAFVEGKIMDNEEERISQYLHQSMWNAITEQKEEETTELELLKYISEMVIQVENFEGRKTSSTIIGALNEAYSLSEKLFPECVERLKDINKALGFYGIALKEKRGELLVFIANKNQLLSKKLMNTPYHHNWNAVLKRLKGSNANEAFHCVGQKTQRGISISFKDYFKYDERENFELKEKEIVGTQDSLPGIDEDDTPF